MLTVLITHAQTDRPTIECLRWLVGGEGTKSQTRKMQTKGNAVDQICKQYTQRSLGSNSAHDTERYAALFIIEGLRANTI